MGFIDRTAVKKELIRLQEDERFQEAVQNIKTGKFERDRTNKDYDDRIVYTMELRNFVYDMAVMNCVLTNPDLKALFFRTFGYEGSLNFTIYPKCWLRDLPLVDIGENTYLGDRILLGTNMVTPDQKEVCVGRITIGKDCIFDQGCAVGYGSTVGNDCKIGFETAMGMKNRIGNNVLIGERSTIGHGNRIADNVKLGSFTKIGHFCIIEEGVELDEYSEIPSYSLVTKEGIFNRRAKKVA